MNVLLTASRTSTNGAALASCKIEFDFIRPAQAFFSKELGEFILPYDVVRTAVEPEQTLLVFLQSTYEAAAELGN